MQIPFAALCRAAIDAWQTPYRLFDALTNSRSSGQQSALSAPLRCELVQGAQILLGAQPRVLAKQQQQEQLTTNRN